jgi:hypothetical protein
MKQGQLDTTFETVLGKAPGNVGVSGEVGGEKLIDEEQNVDSGGKSEIMTPFNVVFNKKG